jgi:acetyl esterase/lipase
MLPRYPARHLADASHALPKCLRARSPHILSSTTAHNMGSDEVDYSRAIRPTPDKSARSAPRPIMGMIKDLLTKLLMPPLVLAELPYLIYLKLFKRQSSPPWSLMRLVVINSMRLSSWVFNTTIPQPRSEQEQWGIPSDGEPFREAIRNGEIDFEVVKLNPVDDSMRRGIANVPAVKGALTPGFWFRPKGVKTDQVILYIHGGWVISQLSIIKADGRGYVRGHPMWSPLAKHLAVETSTPVFGEQTPLPATATWADCIAVNYRKCVSGTTAFPAPLLDALSAYTYLLKTYDASSITFVGDSAGAHLCLFLSRYLLTIDLPQPKAMGLISPWSDFAPAYPSYKKHGWFDFLDPKRLATAVDSAVRWYAPFMKSNVWFSPAKASKGDWSYLSEAHVDMHLTLGTREVFEDEIRLLNDVMERDGVNVRLYEVSPTRGLLAEAKHINGVHTEMNLNAEARVEFIQGLKRSIAKNSS